MRRADWAPGVLVLAAALGILVEVRVDLTEQTARAAGWTIVLLQTIWCAVEAHLQPPRRWRTGIVERRLPILAGSLTGLVVLLALFDLRPRDPHILLGGLALGASGISLRAAAIMSLGEAFLDGVDWGPGQRRMEQGVYRVRHPAELGTLLVLAGTCMCSASPAALGLLLCGVLPTSIIRIQREEHRIHIETRSVSA